MKLNFYTNIVQKYKKVSVVTSKNEIFLYGLDFLLLRGPDEESVSREN